MGRDWKSGEGRTGKKIGFMMMCMFLYAMLLLSSFHDDYDLSSILRQPRNSTDFVW